MQQGRDEDVRRQKVSHIESVRHIAIRVMYFIEAVEHISLIQLPYYYTVTTGGP